MNTLKIIDACIRSYRYKSGIGPVLENEESETLENDFIDLGILDDQPCIVFRGSDDSEDWKENIFLDFSTNLHGRILSWVERRGFHYKTILLVGHSRGASLACEIALYLKALGIKCEVVSFGAPKIKNYKNHIGKYDHKRYTNGADGVPRLPPFFYGWKYGHAVKNIELDKASLWRKSLIVMGILTRHFMKDYRESYIKLMKNVNLKEVN